MEQRVRINDGEGVAGRSIPIPHFQILATAIGSADVIYTVRSPIALEVRHLAVANTSGTAATLNLHTVPSAGSAATANTEIPNISIPGNTVADITDYIGGFYEADTTFQAFSDTTGVLVIHGWAREIL